MSPTEYIKQRCATVRIPYAVVVGRTRVRKVTAFRIDLYIELRERYGLSSRRIGFIMGGRDHSSVINAWRSRGYSVPAPTRRRLSGDEIAELHRLHDAGMAISDIARALKVGHSTVGRRVDANVAAVKRQRTRGYRDAIKRENAQRRAECAQLDTRA